MVTTLFVLTTTGAVALVVQTIGGARLVADSKVKPAAFVGHVTTTLVPERCRFNVGALETNDRL